MKNRISLFVFSGLIILAFLGIVSSLISNPAVFFQRIAITAVIIAVIYFIMKRMNRANPRKNEQRAFVHAAKRSKKRHHHKDVSASPKAKSKKSAFASIKRSKNKSSAQLTVIEGKKGKKKNRASF